MTRAVSPPVPRILERRARFLALPIVLATACTAAPADELRHAAQPLPDGCAAAFYTGVARRDITPTPDAAGQYPYLGGMAARSGPATSVEKPITAGAIAIRDALGNHAVLVALDLTWLGEELVAALRDDIWARTGIAGEYVLVNVSHTHSAPNTRDTPTYGPGYATADPAYMAALRTATVDAVVAAVADADAAADAGQPSAVLFGRTHGVVGKNRRGAPEDYDDTIDVLATTAPGSEAIQAVAFFHGAHPVWASFQADGSFSYAITPDFPGYARDAIEAHLADGGATAPIALFFQGFAGDVNPLDEAPVTGAALAGFVNGVLDGPMTCLAGDIDARNTIEAFPLELAAHPYTGPDGTLQRWEALQHPPTSPLLPTELQILRIGAGATGWRLAALSHEVTAQYGPMLRGLWPTENVTVAGYSNGVSAYFPTERVRVAGGYEGEHAIKAVYNQRGPLRGDVEEHLLNAFARLWPLREDCVPDVRLSASTSGALYYTRYGGALRWYRHDGQASGADAWTGPSVVGSGWEAPSSAFAADAGVQYAVVDGDLLWLKHLGVASGANVWTLGSGVIGTGWNFKRVFAGGGGVLYAIDGANDLRWYKHTAPETGTIRWVAGSGNVVGNGWDFERIFSGGDGVLYAIDGSKQLRWYKHTGNATGSYTWAAGSGNVVGTGWDFLHVFSAGNGVLYAIRRNGDLLWYKHLGTSNGTWSWAAGSGAVIGVGWWPVVNACTGP